MIFGMIMGSVTEGFGREEVGVDGKNVREKTGDIKNACVARLNLWLGGIHLCENRGLAMRRKVRSLSESNWGFSNEEK